MLHESPRHAARCHAPHLLHILEPYGPNRWQSSRIFPYPCALDDMKPPPRPGIPLRHFWHFPATKEGARSDRYAEKLFQTPPLLTRLTETRPASVLWPAVAPRHRLRHPAPHVRIMHTMTRIAARSSCRLHRTLFQREGIAARIPSMLTPHSLPSNRQRI